MSEYRPRRDDHLVEPLFSGIQGAHEAGRSRPSRTLLGLVLVVLAGGLAYWWAT